MFREPTPCESTSKSRAERVPPSKHVRAPRTPPYSRVSESVKEGVGGLI